FGSCAASSVVAFLSSAPAADRIAGWPFRYPRDARILRTNTLLLSKGRRSPSIGLRAALAIGTIAAIANRILASMLVLLRIDPALIIIRRSPGRRRKLGK